MSNNFGKTSHYNSGCSEIGIEILSQWNSDLDWNAECIDVIEASAVLATSFHLGSAFKYLWRAGIKGDELTDLQKALNYCEKWVETSAPVMQALKVKTLGIFDKGGFVLDIYEVLTARIEELKSATN